jgi:hypothetical protein
MESVNLPVHKKGDKPGCSNYRGISLPSTSYKILSNILLQKLSPCTRIDEIMGDHHPGFQRNRSTTDQTVYIRQILEKKMGIKWDSTSAICRLQEAYDSVSREVFRQSLEYS